MKSLILTIFVIFLSGSALAETLEGEWQIIALPEDNEQYGLVRCIKYPTKLIISKKSDVYTIEFTNQYDDKCSGTAVSANKGREIVFEYCGKWGTKSASSWGSIHHAKIVDGKLQGVVTSNKHLFNWIGTRIK